MIKNFWGVFGFCFVFRILQRILLEIEENVRTERPFLINLFELFVTRATLKARKNHKSKGLV
jgi:hypothetical protein